MRSPLSAPWIRNAHAHDRANAIDHGEQETQLSKPSARTTTAAATRAFGVVFADVDLGTSAQLLFFRDNALIASAFAPVLDGGLSFIGIILDPSEGLADRVRIISGTDALGAGVLDQNGKPIDLVVMDDFIFAEPVAQTSEVPEPPLGWLLAVLLPLLHRFRRRCA